MYYIPCPLVVKAMRNHDEIGWLLRMWRMAFSSKFSAIMCLQAGGGGEMSGKVRCGP